MEKNRLPYEKKTGFQVPEGYFDGLEARIFSKVTEAPTRNLPEKTAQPFGVPENYFDSLEEKVMAKIDAGKKPSKVIPLLQRESFYAVAGVAAVFVVIFSTFLFTQPEPVSVESLELLAIENYLEESIDPNSEVSRLYSDGSNSLAPSGHSGLDQEAVMEYLQETLEDPIVILNEY